MSEPVKEAHEIGLASMPDEILWEICLRIDSLEDFGRVSRRFHVFTKASKLRAEYFVRVYGPPYALFHAIARPRIFRGELCKELVAAGATVSLALVQELTKRYFSTDAARKSYEDEDAWGLNLSFSGAVAVIRQGSTRYKNLRLQDSDLERFLQWTSGRLNLQPTMLEEMFLDRQFAPLPLRLKGLSDMPTKVELSRMLEITSTVGELMYTQRVRNQRKRKAPSDDTSKKRFRF